MGTSVGAARFPKRKDNAKDSDYSRNDGKILHNHTPNRVRPARKEHCFMSFTFLHASDLHLGSPFIGLALKDEDVAKRFASASREAFSDLVSRALELKVAFVVIAGDVYDGEWRDTSIGLFFNREIARLDRADIPVFLLRGNHDAESVVTKSISLPNCVRQFPANKPTSFRIDELKVAIHGRSFPDRAVTENYALTYPDPVQGWFNIGVLHTSCDGRPGHAVYAPCTVDDLARRGYQYWALGHVHEYEELARDPWIVFPGNLQGRSVRECGPKGAVLVEVDDGRVIAVERLILDRARWAVLTVDVSDIDDETFALRKIEEAIQPVAEQAEGRLLALRVRLAGESGLHRRLKAEPHRFSDEIQAAAQRCHEDIWLERLRVETTDAARSHATDEGVPSIDLSAMLHGIEDDPAVRSAAADLISMVVGKIPGGITTEETTLGGNLDALLAEAQAVILGRVKG
jgi:DNA repair exonuclease SbcCD nuclease subunit